MGVLDTSEKLAGVVGPTLGGALYTHHPLVPVFAVTASYLVMIAGILVAFPRFVLPALRDSSSEMPKPKQE